MTTNPLERAVIEAARSMVWDRVPHSEDEARLHKAIETLNAWEATQDPEVREVGWHEVTEGDLLKSVKNGKFYEVEYVLTLRDKKTRQIKLKGIEKRITRPNPEEPSAFVKRGQAGAAVDMFVNVFSSGGK